MLSRLLYTEACHISCYIFCIGMIFLAKKSLGIISIVYYSFLLVASFRNEYLSNPWLSQQMVSLRCRGGRRRIVPLDGDEPTQEAPLATMLARAWSWQRAIDEGRYANGKELADALGIDRY